MKEGTAGVTFTSGYKHAFELIFNREGRLQVAADRPKRVRYFQVTLAASLPDCNPHPVHAEGQGTARTALLHDVQGSGRVPHGPPGGQPEDPPHAAPGAWTRAVHV